MRNVVFVAPFPLDTTMRFARADAGLADVRMLGIMQEAPRGGAASLFADLITVGDGLDAGQLVEAARVLERRHGPIHRVLGILEALQVQLGEVRRALGVPGAGPDATELIRDKARMKIIELGDGVAKLGASRLPLVASRSSTGSPVASRCITFDPMHSAMAARHSGRNRSVTHVT
jgi:hypothetical protein